MASRLMVHRMITICAVPGSLQSGSTAAIWNHDLLKEALLVTFQSLLLEDSPTLLEKFKVLVPKYLFISPECLEPFSFAFQVRLDCNWLLRLNIDSYLGPVDSC